MGQFRLQCRQWQAASFLPIRKGSVAVIFTRDREEAVCGGAGQAALASQRISLTLYAASQPAWGNLKQGKKESGVVSSEFCAVCLVAFSSSLSWLWRCTALKRIQKPKKQKTHLESTLWLFFLQIELPNCVFLCLWSWNTQVVNVGVHSHGAYSEWKEVTGKFL